MSAIDFKEIPEAHLGGGLQDTFELFTRDFLHNQGFRVEESPSRGADGGKDIIVTEQRSGVGGETVIRWLVSCKHKAHSGTSVTPQDEPNIRDRVEANQCDGFMGFYSTLPSSGLADVIRGLSSKTETLIYDREKIESYLLRGVDNIHLAKRYFPTSTAKWLGNGATPAKIFATHPPLHCMNCGKDLLNPKPSGIVVLCYRRDKKTEKDHYEKIYWCCKGHCDQTLAHPMRELGLYDGWEDIPDIAIPLIFAKWIMSIMNELYRGDRYSEEAFDKLKELTLSIYPYIARNATEEEIARIESLSIVPAQFGGLNFGGLE